MTPHPYTAIVAGATGLIGDELVKQLLEDSQCKAILVMTRREIPYQDKRLIQCVHPRLEICSQHLPELSQAPIYGFIALGTTIKQAGSKQALADIDYTLVCDVAQQMRELGTERLCVVSSIGASATSMSHYLKCKGLMEEKIAAMSFDNLCIVRPGPLEGLREKTRPSEAITASILKLVKPVMKGKLRNYRLIHGKTVAQAMLAGIKSDKKAQVLFSREMEAIVRRTYK
ncbi:predicted nucleoside-diphosphate-sugar epimerases [Vibrio astriarenae]|uniref:NAD(P)H-binding protein n=1 Tax=Vibrio astriarenae TaxID=1481923 RepID=UPI000506F9CC|nr:predicted nucleoside-diphosphate-sugar epimerases [Vibrio sp. C7]